MGITTLNNDTLYSTNTDMYVGAVNTPTTEINSSGNRFYILRGNNWVNVGQDNFAGNFNYRDVVYDETTGLYTFHGEVVPTENLYVINGNVGIFTTTKNGNEIYKGDVYGHNNEILVTGVDNDGKYVSYWGSENVDPNAPIGSMPISTLQYKFDVVNDNIKNIHKDDIKQINIGDTAGTVGNTDNGQGGTIGLQTNGEFDADGNPTGGAMIPGGITVSSVGGTNGEDVRIKFANDEGSFTVDAGSKVEAQTENGGNALTGLSINGEKYSIAAGGETYTAGNNIEISEDNVISAKDTTLDESASTSESTANGYGKNYKVVDTDGNTVNIQDVASASKLEEVAGDAAKHTSVSTNDSNLSIENTAGEGEAANYEVKLNKDLKVDSVTAGGENGTVINSSGLSVGGKTYVTSSGLNANSQQISNVLAGDDDTDAVNVAQLKSYVSGNATYTAGDGINISENRVVSVDTGNGLGIEDGKVVAKAGTNVTIDENGISAKDTTLDESASTSESTANGYGKNYKVVDTDGNTVNIQDVASASKLEDVDVKVGDLNYSNVINEGDSLIVNDNDSVTTAISKIDTKVDAGWTATADSGDPITVNPTNHTLKFTGDDNITVSANTANRAIQVKLNPVVTLDGDASDDNKIVLDGDNGTINATNSKDGFLGKSTTNTFDFSDGGKFVTTEETKIDLPLVGEKTISKVEHKAEFNEKGATFTKEEDKLIGGSSSTTTNIDGGTITTGNVTAGDIKVNVGDSGTITGLTNTTLDATDFAKSKRAATEEQLQAAMNKIDADSYKGWSVSANGESATPVKTGSTVDFSGAKDSNGNANITVTKKEPDADGNTSLAFDLADNITLGNEEGQHIQLNGNPEDGNNMISIANGEGDTVFSVDQDGTLSSDGDVFAYADDGKYSLSEVSQFAVRYDKNKDGTPNKNKIILGGDTYGYDEEGNAVGGTTITNVAKGVNDSDAVNVAQLKDVETLAGQHTSVTVGDNLGVTSSENSNGGTDYKVTLNDTIYLGGSHTAENNNILLDGENGKIGVGSSIALDGSSGTAVIGGVNVKTTYDQDTGKPSSTITGLANTTWDNDLAAEVANSTELQGTASTQGQLQTVANEASKHTTMTVNGGNAAPGDGSYTSGNLQLKQTVNNGQIEYDVKLNDTLVLGISDDTPNNNVVVDGNNGSILVNAQGDNEVNSIEIDAASGTITGLKGAVNNDNWTTFMDPNSSIDDTRAATESDLRLVAQHSVQYAFDDTTNTVDYNTIKLAGEEYKNGEGGTTITNVAQGVADSDAVNVAQLKGYVSDNATYTEGDGINIARNEETKENVVSVNAGAGLGFSKEADEDGTKKLEVKVGDNLEIDENNAVALKDRVALGNDQIIIDGTENNGYITIGNVNEAENTGIKLSKDGSANFGAIQVNKETGNTITGLTNTEWSAGTIYNSGRAATEEQLSDVANWTIGQIANSGWVISTNNNKGEEAKKENDVKNGDVVDFSNTDGNIVISQEKTENGVDVKFDLADDITLGHGDNGAYVDIYGSKGKVYVGSGSYNITIDGTTGTISGLSNTHWDPAYDYRQSTQAATEAQLQQAINNAQTEFKQNDQHLVANPDTENGHYFVDGKNQINLQVQNGVDENGTPKYNTITIDNVASATDVGNIGDLNADIAHDSTGDGNVSIVDAVNNVDNKVGSLDYKHDDDSDLNYVTAGDSVTDAIGDLDAAIKDTATVAGQHSSVSVGNGIDLSITENGASTGGTDYKVSLKDDFTLGGKEDQTGSIAITGSEGTINASGNISAGSFTTGDITINGTKEDGTHTGTINGLSNTTWNQDIADAVAENANGEASVAASQGQLQQAMSTTVQYDRNEEDGSVNKGSITLGGTTYNEETHEGGTTITNVADGKNASDAVNMNQLWRACEKISVNIDLL